MKRDEHVFSADCVEMFILPYFRTRTYWELVVSPSNSVFDGLHSKNNEWAMVDRRFENIQGLKTATAYDGTLNTPGDTDTGYTIEVAVPFSELPEYSRARPAAGQKLNLMLVRLDKNADTPLKVYTFQPLLSWGHNIWNHTEMVLGN